MGYVDTHNDYYPVGEQERLEDEQKELDKKAVRRIQQANAKGTCKAFRILLVQALLEEGSAVAQSGLEPTGLEPQCGEPTTPSRSTQMPLMWMIATCIIILALLARWAYKRLRRAQGEVEQRLTNLDAHIHELEAATREASTRTERSISVLLQSAASTSVEMHNVRGDVSALLEAIRGLRRSDSSSEDEGTIAITTDVPGLQEAILRHAGERVVQQREPPTVDRVGEGGSEDEEHPSQHDESHHGSEWYPGQSEDEAFRDNAQWADEYRHILAYEREHGLLVSPMSSPIRASEPLHPGENRHGGLASSANGGLQPEEEPLRAGHT